MSQRLMGLLIGLLASVLAACTPENSLMPTPAIYLGSGARSIFAGALATNPPHELDLLYVTDREPTVGPGGELAYSSGRSQVMTFGSVALAIEDEGANGGKKSIPGLFKIGTPRMIGAFPRTPYGVHRVAGGITRDSTAVSEHVAAVRGLQAEVSRRLANAKRKEVVIFIHGYSNTFSDAAYSTGNLCRFLGVEFVCVVLSWPAGGTSGVLAGYNVDRESGEFAVADMRKAIRAIGETKGVTRIHIIAHSRGTDVAASALQQLAVESYGMKTSLSQRLKINNVVLASPDIDVNVAVSKILTVASDPDLPFGPTPSPSVVFPQGDIHLTIYSSPNDKALELSGFLFGSIARLGQVDPIKRAAGLSAAPPDLAGLVDLVAFEGSTNFIGHNYFLSDPQVSSDIVGLIRYHLKAGEPGRPLEEIKRPFWRIVVAE